MEYTSTSRDNMNQSINDIAYNLTNVAETGVKVLDKFMSDLTPKVETVINSVFNEGVHRAPMVPKTELYFMKKTDKAILIACELPRVEKQNCKIKVINNVLTINATSSLPSEMEQFNFIDPKEYTISITVPKDINKEQITAKIIDGVLYIQITKSLNNIDEINIL